MKRRFTKRHVGALVIGLALASWAQAQVGSTGDELPSADSIIDRYIEVTGGAAAYAARESNISRGTMTIGAAGITGQLEIHTRPGLQHTKLQLPNIGVIESGVKDGVAWESSFVMGPRILTGTEAEFALMGATPTGPLVLKDRFAGRETTGIEEVAGEPAYRVMLTRGEMSVAQLFSVESGRLLRTQMTLDTPLGKIPVEQTVEEYTDFGGIQTPSRMSINQAGNRVIVTVSSVEANVDIPDEEFAFPDEIQALIE